MMAVDRYFCTTKPFSYPATRTSKRALFMILSAWGISLLFSVIPIFTWQYFYGRKVKGPFASYKYLQWIIIKGSWKWMLPRVPTVSCLLDSFHHLNIILSASLYYLCSLLEVKYRKMTQAPKKQVFNIFKNLGSEREESKISRESSGLINIPWRTTVHVCTMNFRNKWQFYNSSSKGVWCASKFLRVKPTMDSKHSQLLSSSSYWVGLPTTFCWS